MKKRTSDLFEEYFTNLLKQKHRRITRSLLTEAEELYDIIADRVPKHKENDLEPVIDALVTAMDNWWLEKNNMAWRTRINSLKRRIDRILNEDIIKDYLDLDKERNNV